MASVDTYLRFAEAVNRLDLTQTETANGYANRHLWVCAERSKLLPEGGAVDQQAWREAREELTNAVTRYSQTTTTDSQGAYRLIDVPFNDYLLTVEAKGFETTTREVKVHSNLAQQIDVQLGVAPVRQEVNVTAEPGLIEPEKTAPTTVIDRNLIQRFPTSQPRR